MRHTRLNPLSDTSLRLKAIPLWWRHIRSRWWVYLIGILGVMATNVTEVLVPKCIQWGLDWLQERENVPELFHSFNQIAFFFVGVLMLQALTRGVWRLTLGQETHRMTASLKSAIWDRARFFPKRRLERDLSPGHLMNQATSDVGSARFLFGWTLTGTVDFIFLGSMTLIMMASISMKLTLLSVAAFSFVPFVLKSLAVREKRQHLTAQRALSSLNELVAQAIGTVRLQRLSQVGHFWEKKLNQYAEEYRQKRLDVIKTSLLFFLSMGLTPLLAYAILFGVGLNDVLANRLSIGEFIALQNLILLLQGPLAEVGFLISEWQRGLGSLERLSETFRAPLEPKLIRSGLSKKPAEETKKAGAVLSVRDLAFRYPGQDEWVLKNLHFTLYRKEKLGIQGRIGTGKSSLLHILGGLEFQYQGEVYLLGKELQEWDHDELRRHMVLVHQKPFLFADTIRQNVSLDQDLSDESIWYYLEQVEIADEIYHLPGQLSTRLGEWGINLSGGQKQRLTLARALSRAPSILLLDDCLSAVDTVTEEQVLMNLERELKEITVVWVAHRQSTLKHCDRILEFSA